MGEIAEMILDGTLCEQCGCFIGEPVGYPRLCEDCDEEYYDFNELIKIINVAIDQIIEYATPKQKQVLINKLYAKLNKLKKGKQNA